MFGSIETLQEQHEIALDVSTYAVPKIYPDECLDGYACRIAYLNGRCCRQTLERFRNNRTFQLFVERANNKSLEEMKARHSLSSFGLIKRQYSHRGTTDVNYTSARRMHYRSCPSCTKIDADVLGHTYFRLYHQIPTMRVCLEHHCRIVDMPRDSFSKFRVEPVPVASKLDIEYAKCMVELNRTDWKKDGKPFLRLKAYCRAQDADDVRDKLSAWPDDLQKFYIEKLSVKSSKKPDQIANKLRSSSLSLPEMIFFRTLMEH